MVILTELAEASYDVFLSFRGADTRLGFTNHLYNALLDANLTTFLDDEEIPTGEFLKPELETAIKASRACVIVLSENYASSTWCLDELVLILEQKRISNQIVIPVFYHVEPTHVRKQQSSFGEAMEKHNVKIKEATNEEERRRLGEKMEKWKEALTQVSNLKGKDASGRKEIELIEEVVTEIHRRLGGALSNTLPLLIGRYKDINHINWWLTDDSSHTADILTVVGMSGIGKTYLAKYIYHQHSAKFQKGSFIEGINARCNERFNGLLKLQKQLLEDISKKVPLKDNDVFVCTSMIEKALAHKRVFIVLDDIGSLDQLDALLGNKGLHPGSKIIITTKYASLTERCAIFNSQLQPKHDKLSLNGLNEYESLELLCLHAFKSRNPIEGYEEVLEELVKYCDGHPLALMVLGRSLHKRDVAYWEECIKGLKKEPHYDIKKALRMSFDLLSSDNDKDLFKHIACFFVGINRDVIETILNACDINTRSGIINLIERCLLSIGWNNELVMHQLVQEMGRDLVRQESPDRPWERSRIWCHKESFKVLEQEKGTENILGIALDMRMLEKERLHGSLQLKTEALNKMGNLRLLQLNYTTIKGSYKNISKELRWLCMHGFHLKSIPSELPMENLVVLDMSYSNIESFDMSYRKSHSLLNMLKGLTGSSSTDKPLLGSLKILDLSFCEQLRSLGGFYELPVLERLIISNCTNLIQMYYEFGIFSTLYEGIEMPNWISCRMKGSSISFTIPSSPNKLKGLNLCCRMEKLDEGILLPRITIINTTKKHTWRYSCYISSKVVVAEESLIFVSHWMFGKNEMEDGDEFSIELHGIGVGTTRECGVGLVYDDGRKKGDALGYYKSWNHIIGGDLSPFQFDTHSGYYLDYIRFWAERNSFRAFSQQKSDLTVYRHRRGSRDGVLETKRNGSVAEKMIESLRTKIVIVEFIYNIFKSSKVKMPSHLRFSLKLYTCSRFFHMLYFLLVLAACN